MSRGGPKGPSRDPSSVEKAGKQGWFYVFQGLLTYVFKLGFSIDPDARGRQHETSGGPQRMIAVIDDPGREYEGLIFPMLREFRLTDPEGERGDFELFQPVPEIFSFLRRTAKEMGFTFYGKPRDPRRQTAKDWLKLARVVGRGKIRDAANHNLDEEARLRSKVPRSARGGWDLTEILGGNGFPNRQEVMGFAQRLVHQRSWIVNEITYKGMSYEFVVFAEWYERERGLAAPAGAVRAGIPILRPKLALSPETRKAREVARAARKQAAVAVPAGQGALF
jgi:hypothetical protein